MFLRKGKIINLDKKQLKDLKKAAILLSFNNTSFVKILVYSDRIKANKEVSNVPLKLLGAYYNKPYMIIKIRIL